MRYQLRLEPAAEQQLRRLHTVPHAHVRSCLHSLAEDPYGPATEAVSAGPSDLHRFALVRRPADDHAVFIVFTVDPQAQVVTVSHIGLPEQLAFDL